MATGSNIVARALRKLGAIDPGEALPADLGAVGLEELNAMFNTLGTSKLNIYSINRNVFPLVIGQQSYTLGTTGADFTLARPQRIDMASVVPASDATQEIPIEMISDADWREISVKSTRSSWPTECLVTNGFPMWTIEVWPVPSELSSIVLYTWQPLQQLASLSTVLAMPEGYEDWAVYNLVVRLAPDLGAAVTPELAMIASETRQLIKTANFIPVITEIDSAWCIDSGPSAEAASTYGYVVD